MHLCVLVRIVACMPVCTAVRGLGCVSVAVLGSEQLVGVTVRVFGCVLVGVFSSVVTRACVCSCSCT